MEVNMFSGFYLVAADSDKQLQDCLKTLNKPMLNREDGTSDKTDCEALRRVCNGDVNGILFILSDFSGNVFHQLQADKRHITGTTAIVQHVLKNIPLTITDRPVFTFSMRNLVVSFAGLTDKTEGDHLLSLLKLMGGSSRKDVTDKCTHLVSCKASGAKYRKAMAVGIVILTRDWIKFSWEQRLSYDYNPVESGVIQKFMLKPFSGLYLAFLDFSAEELKEMEDLTRKNDGLVVQANQADCTHLVVNAVTGDSHVIDVCLVQPSLHVVYREWFWSSIQIGGKADESTNSHAFPVLGSRNMSKIRRSTNCSKNSLGILSPALDYSPSLDNITFATHPVMKTNENEDFASFTERHKICCELLTTEKNYIEVIQLIVQEYKIPSELAHQGQFLIAPTEAKIIFGNIPPILDVHKLIHAELQKLLSNWRETNNIGKIFVDHASALKKAYPPFVNFYETIRETLNSCDQKYTRFHALLKRMEVHPSIREPLRELLIRPVQRIPSIKLILGTLLKRTDPSFEDHHTLQVAIKSLEGVLELINEDKRKTEGQIAMFDIVNDIENCPPDLLSANRKFIAKSDAKLLVKGENGEILPVKGYCVTLFLFNDTIEICKKRSLKRGDSLSSKGGKKIVPSSTGSSKSVSKKSYRHIEQLKLALLKKIWDFDKSKGFDSTIVIIADPDVQDRFYKIYPFVLCDAETDKSTFMEQVNKCLNQNRFTLRESLIEEATDMSFWDCLDFGYAEDLCRQLTRSNLTISRTKERFKNAFTRRQSMSFATPPLQPISSHLATASPLASRFIHSPRRLSRTFSSFVNPFKSSLMKSTTSLNDIHRQEPEGTFSLPSTPAPRKKKCQNEDFIAEYDD